LRLNHFATFTRLMSTGTSTDPAVDDNCRGAEYPVAGDLQLLMLCDGFA
jgi:hypothetical protein